MRRARVRGPGRGNLFPPHLTPMPGDVRFAEQTSCCHRHMPRPGDVLTEGAVPIEVVIQDASTKIVVRDGQAEVTVSERFVSAQP